jgi:hypothetical protein
MQSGIPRTVRLAVGLVLLLVSGAMFTVLSDMNSAVGATNVGYSWIVPIFPALMGIFLIIHGFVVGS